MLKAMKWLLLFSIVTAILLHRGGISIQAHLLWVIALFPLFILEIFETKDKKNWNIEKKIIWCIVIFSILIVASLMTSKAENYGFFEVTGILAGIGTFLLTSQWNNEEKIKKFFSWSTFLTAILILIGLGIYMAYPPDRLFGTFAQFPTFFSHFPNAFALLILISLAFSFARIMEKTDVILVIIMGIHVAGLILTFSRGSLLTAILISMIAAIFFRKNLKKLPWKKITAALILSGIIFTAAQYIRQQNFEINTIQQKISLKSKEQKRSINDRLAFYKGSIKLIQEKPLLGHGPDTFKFVYPRHQKNLLENSDHPHNLFLKLAVENGIPATMAFITLIIFIFIQVIKSRNIFAKFLLIPISAIIIHNIFDYNLNFAGTQMLFWTMLGFTHSLTKDEKKSITLSKPIVILMIFLFSIAGIYEIWQRVLIIQGRNFINTGHYEEALKNFQKAKPLFGEEIGLMKAEAMRLLKKTEEIKEIEKEVEKNPAVSELKSALAQLHMIKEENKYALLLINAAIQQDNRNWLRYYYLQAILQKKLELPINIKNLKKLLKEYLPLMRKNRYNTIATDNPGIAIKIARFINEEGMAKKLTFFAKIERKKFQKMYHLELAPL